MTQLPECDMVMKGGITSGVVYPRAVADLSSSYRFRRIGGSSAGAIAAAAAAAAEHNRDGGGFEKLARLPDELASNLKQLFHPESGLAPVFAVALDAIENKNPRTTALALVRLAVRPVTWAWQILLTLALDGVIALFSVSGWAGGFGLAIWLVILGVLAAAKLLLDLGRLVSSTIQRVNANNFGICDGQTAARGYPETPAPLTQWLTELLNDVAGLPADETLTFGHLWGPEAVAAYRTALTADEQNPPSFQTAGLRRIDLQMMTTNVSMGRPYTMPLDVRTYLWCPVCLGRYFNEDVIRWMTECESAEQPDPPLACPLHEDVRLWKVPAAPDLPVVVAVRLSLSYPVLFSAVPLHIVDRSRPQDKQGVRICWFADGGISSNFPIHLFDSMWPLRPTFALSLGPKDPDYSSKVYRPKTPQAGIHLRIADISSAVSFLVAIMRTMQNWADSLQKTQPGYRDRVVEVQTAPGQGGLNLTMSPDQILDLAGRGGLAAAELGDFDFDTHQWVRYRSTMSELCRLFESMADAWAAPDVGVARLVKPGYKPKHMVPQSGQWSADDRAATAHLVATIEAWRALDYPGLRSSPPRPSPQIRLTPRL